MKAVIAAQARSEYSSDEVSEMTSTSLPGLCAKPIINMLLVVADSADEPSYVTCVPLDPQSRPYSRIFR